MVCRRKIAITAAPPTNKTKSAALGPSINDISRERGGDWPIPDQKKKNCLELTEAGKKNPEKLFDVIHGWPLRKTVAVSPFLLFLLSSSISVMTN